MDAGGTSLSLMAIRIAGVSLILGFQALPAFAQDTPAQRIAAVTLSSGGLAEVRRSVRATGPGTIGFDIPLDQADDILKSLTVRDPGGGVAAMTLDGLAQMDEVFRRLPFSPDDMAALPRLLGALQGIRVRVTSGGRTVDGAVLGVEERPGGTDGEDASDPLLSVMTPQGHISVLRLRADTQLEILDEAMRERLREAASVSGRGRTDDMRAISIELAGEGAREVLVDYVVPAPVWKTAYRLILDADGAPRLQAWAVIENATGEDWDDVALTLSSGAPVTLRQRLHQRYWHERPEVPVAASTAVPPRPDRAAGRAVLKSDAQADEAASARRLGALGAGGRMVAPALAAEPSISVPADLTLASESETAATWHLPQPVDLAAGRTLSIPFIDVELEAERIALFQPERGQTYPVAAIRLENGTGTSLPPGIVTVYAPDAEGYAGDAVLQGVPVGESRMVSFADDRKVEVRTEPGRDETVVRASLAQGVLRTARTIRSTTVYTVHGAEDGSRTVVIEHPRRSGWRFSTDAAEETTPTHHRLRVEVGQGGTATVEATVERTDSQSIALIDADADALVYWSGQVDDPASARILTDLAERRRGIARAEQEVAQADGQMRAAADNQARIRENLAAVPGDSRLGQRYVGMLEEEEDRIAQLRERSRQAQARVEELRREFTERVGAN